MERIKISNWIKKILPKRENSLLKIVEKQKKTNKKIKKILKKKSDPIWMPSFSSFLKIFGVVFIFWLISHPAYFSWISNYVYNLLDYLFGQNTYYQYWISFLDWLAIIFSSIESSILKFDESIHYQNLIVIHSGIGAVLIGLAFFIAQTLADKNDPEKGRVLLYESWFFPLLTAEILIFFLFIWGSLNMASMIPIVLMGLVTIWRLGKVISILIEDYKMEKAKRDMFFKIIKNKFIKLLDFEVTKRFGISYLVKEFKDNKIMEVSPFGPIREDDYVPIKSSKTGLFSDISLKNLNTLLKTIDIQQDNKNSNFNDKISDQNNIQSTEEYLCYLIPIFHTEIENGDTLFWVKKETFDTIKNIENLVQKVFVIQKRDDFKKEVRSEISKIKDRAITAISKKQTGELGKIIQLYIELAKEFSGYLELYGGGFSQKQAEDERANFFDRLKAIDWISHDIREVFERGMKSGDKDIVREVAYLPIRLLKHAIENKDHLMFQEFVYFPQLLYSYAFQESRHGDDKLADLMFDRTWRYLKELSNYHLEPKLKKDDFPEDDFKGFAIYIFKTFQYLLKNALDNRDIKNFNNFLSALSSLFEHTNRHHYRRKKEGIDKVIQYINNKRNQLLFGLASWTFFLWQNNEKDLTLKECFDAIKNRLPQTIEEFTKIFLDTHQFETEDFWGWDNWDMEGKDEGVVHNIQILEKLEAFYAVHSLRLLQSKTDEEIKTINLPPSRDLAFLSEGTRDLMGIINNIKDNPTNWEFVLNKKAVEKIPAFKELLSGAKENQEKLDLERKRGMEISDKKVNNFKEGLIKDHYEYSIFKNLLKEWKLYEDKTNHKYSGKLNKLGINRLFDKVPFFDDQVGWHVHVMGIDNGFDFGRAMANGENDNILEIIRKKSKKIKDKDFENELRSISNLSNAVIIGTNNAIWDFLAKSKNYKPIWNRKNISGSYSIDGKDISVYQAYDNGDSDIFILDKTKLGKLVQYSPLGEDENKKIQKDIFTINVQNFSQEPELVQEFIDKKIDWLIKQGNEERQKEHLYESVLIQIYERFEFEPYKDFIGYYFTVKKK